MDTMKHFNLTAAPFNKLPHFYNVSPLKLSFTVIFIYLFYFYFYRTLNFSTMWSLLEQYIDSYTLHHVPQVNSKSKSRLVSLSVALRGTSSKCCDICSVYMRLLEVSHYHIFCPPNLLDFSQHVTVTLTIFKWSINCP